MIEKTLFLYKHLKAKEPVMSKKTRSPRFLGILLFALALCVAQCGDDNEVVVEDLDCAVEDFLGGIFVFTIYSLDDDCTVGAHIEPAVIPGVSTFGPVDLPATQDLPATRDILFIPLGIIVENVEIKAAGGSLQLSAPAQDFIIGFIPSFRATTSGTLCPAPEGGVLADIVITATSADGLFIPTTPCNVTITGIGT
jgi:hypothetical protein